MAVEKTFVMLKPDSIKRGLVGEIIARIEKKGYRIVDARMMRLDPQFLYLHYAHIADQPYFLDVFKYMQGDVLGMCVSGDNVVIGMRQLIGATRFEDAAPGSIRGDFATSTVNNLIHGSDSPEAAEMELERFFGEVLRKAV